MNNVKISMVTVCFNSAATIQDTLKSVALQSHPPLEHILVDGGSTDRTLSIIRQWKEHAVRLICGPDQGIFDAMNKGIMLAEGDVIGILNSDDVFYGNNVLKRVAERMQDTSVDACYGDLIYVRNHDHHKIVRYWKSGPFQKGLFSRGWVPPHPTFFVRRRIYEQYGLFDLDYSLAADFELMARFLENIKSGPFMSRPYL